MIRWQRRPGEIPIQSYAERVQMKIQQQADRYASIMEASAKVNAPWTDRTGKARAGLFGTVDKHGNVITVVLAHSMEYGVYLELAHGGKYAILWPTVIETAPKLMRELHL